MTAFVFGVGIGAFGIILIEALAVAAALWLCRRAIQRSLWS